MYLSKRVRTKDAKRWIRTIEKFAELKVVMLLCSKSETETVLSLKLKVQGRDPSDFVKVKICPLIPTALVY